VGYTKRHSLRFAAALALAGMIVLPIASASTDNGRPGKGKGRHKVTLCHKGKLTITVAAPAVTAHLKHGDKLGTCPAGASPAPPAPGTAVLTVIKHVVNNNGGTKTASDFTLTITGVTASGGNSFAGSETGVTKIITTFGAYNLTESAVVGYAQTGASGCSGTIAAGEQKTCTITNDDVPATLTVIKHVVNDSGRSKTAGAFTLTITGVTASGGNSFAGSESGVSKTLLSIGSYSVSEPAVLGYALKSLSVDCAGVIALGQHKTCTVTNDDVPS